MTPDNLDTLSDAELNECFAVEVAGWTLVKNRLDRIQPKDAEDRWVIDWDFSTDANAVLPWLEVAFNRPSIAWLRNPSIWGIECGNIEATAPTFARAACIALIRAKRASP